jgi:hypothetical protein
MSSQPDNVRRPKNIKKKLAHAVIYSRTLVRLKHYRGARVHSPFVYGIVRNAIMKKTPQCADHPLFDELRRRGFSRRRAAQLQNLYTFHNYSEAVFAGNNSSFSTESLCFIMPSLPAEDIPALVELAAETGSTLCLTYPYAGRNRSRLARRLVAEHRHTSIDNRGFLLLFFNPRLPKQHFKL